MNEKHDKIKVFHYELHIIINLYDLEYIFKESYVVFRDL